MAKGNKYGITKDDTRYGDMAQPKHTNEWGYHEDQSPPSQGKSPPPEMNGGGESIHINNDDHPDDRGLHATQEDHWGTVKK